MERQLEWAIERGVAFLCHMQRTDGSFDSFSSPLRNPFQPVYIYNTTFVPAVILGALSRVPAAAGIRAPLASWLLAQRSPQGSFNYWAADAAERTTLSYPDDLDDTFCALSGLAAHDSTLVDAGALGAVVRLLVAAERAVGGPYRTWLVAPDAPAIWQDVDLAVNANVAYFLRQVAHPLPNVTALLEQAITANKFVSPYYPSVYPLLYYVARAYRGTHSDKLIADMLQRRRQGYWGTALHTALAMSALAEQGYTGDIKLATKFLCAAQQADGSWPAEAFCLDPARNGKRFYDGAAALSTALALEALQHRYTALRPVAGARRSRTFSAASAGNAAKAVFAHAQKTGRSLPRPLSRHFNTLIQRLSDSRSGPEITLLPLLFAHSLKEGKAVPDDILHGLGLANLYGWAAYTVYDDFLDGVGDPLQLSAANVALRYSTSQFHAAVPTSAAYQAFVTTVFNTIDNANAWEVASCRLSSTSDTVLLASHTSFTQLKRLAERSLGHALPPLGVLAHLGITPHSSPGAAVLSGCKHYLIARQLLDDLHDWEDDLSSGRITYVVAQVLAIAHVHAGQHKLKPLLRQLQPIFWQQALGTVSATLLRHIAQAKRDFHRSGILAEPSPFITLINDLETATKHTLTEANKAVAFMAGYTER